MTLEEINEMVELADRNVVYPLTGAQRANLRGGVVKMARALREQPRDTALDDAARYLRALWPQGTRMMFDAESAGCAWLRWEPKQGPVMSVSVPIVEGEAPSATLARLVARLREMAVAERDAADARASTLRAAIGGES
jgi:hypothetical protein